MHICQPSVWVEKVNPKPRQKVMYFQSIPLDVIDVLYGDLNPTQS